MQMKPHEEFSKAFGAEEEAAMDPTMHEEHAEAAGADPVAADPAAADAASDAPGNEADGNAPTKDAPEGEADTPAVAVVLNAEGDDDSDVPAEDMQAFKSWRGRLKKREEELAAREAALGGREQAPAALKDGGAVTDELDATGAGAESSAKIETEQYDDGSSATGVAELPEQSPTEQATATVSGDDTDAILKSFEEDYGPEFVAAIDTLIDKRARAIVEEMGGAYVSDLSSRIEEVMRTAEEGMGRMHGDVLTALRDDAEEIANSPEFQAWIDGLEGEEKATAERVVASGRLKEILALFKQYDGSKGGGEASDEDKWAADAAAGVKGSAPIKLPTRAPASPDDEYRKAWAEA